MSTAAVVSGPWDSDPVASTVAAPTASASGASTTDSSPPAAPASASTPNASTPWENDPVAPTSYGDPLNPFSGGPSSPSYLKGKLDQNLGVADAAIHYARGAVAPFVGGLDYLGSLALGRGTDQALADKNAIESDVTGTPVTPEGQADVNAVNQTLAPVGRMATRGINAASDEAADIGGPVAGAAVKTALQGAPYIIGGLNPARSVLSDVVGDASANASDIASSALGREPAVSAAAMRQASRSAAPAAANTAARSTYSSPELTGTAADDTVGTAAATPPKYEAAPPPANGQPAASAELPADTQAQRAQTLSNIGLTQARESAISGDRKAAATDYQTSKLDNTPGQKAAAAFGQERGALDNYSDRLVSDTGGSAGLDENALHARGQTIMAPLEGLDDAYTTQVRQLYGAADSKGQGVPVALSRTANVIADKPEFVGTVEGQQLLQGVNSFLRKAGIADESGNIQGATVQQAEQFKQYLNGQWTPRTSRLIRTVKDSVDDDVTSSAGSDVYGAARALRAKRAAVLDNPKGIGSLLDSSGPDGINRKVPYESVPDKILRMPVDQFGHVVKTLQSAVDGTEQVEPALKFQAQQALNEIRSQAMLRLQEQAQRFKGSWNNRGVTQYLNQNSAKLARIFTPRELARIRTLNDAGNILDVDRTYPGAAAQTANFAMRGLIGAVRHGAGYVGAALSHGAVGDMAGDVVGTIGAKALEKRYGVAGVRMRDLKVNPKVQPVMEQVLSHPKAGSWLRGKTTGEYLRMMAKLGSGAELQRAADALQGAGQRKKDPNAAEAARAVRDAIRVTTLPPDAETRTYRGASYYLTPGSDRRQEANWVKYAVRPVPRVGAVEKGFRFLGGDPSKPTSWQRQYSA